MMADQSLSIGDLVRVIGPSADGSTFALAEDTKIVDVRYSDTHQALFACPIDGWGVMDFPTDSLQLMHRGREVRIKVEQLRGENERLQAQRNDLMAEVARLQAREAALVEIAEVVASMRVETEIFDQPLHALMHDEHETDGAWHLALVSKARALLAEGEGQ